MTKVPLGLQVPKRILIPFEKQLFRVQVLVPHSVGSRRSRLLSDQWSVMGGTCTEHEGPRNFESPAPFVGVLLPLGII